jgi:hypothetical protein
MDAVFTLRVLPLQKRAYPTQIKASKAPERHTGQRAFLSALCQLPGKGRDRWWATAGRRRTIYCLNCLREGDAPESSSRASRKRMKSLPTNHYEELVTTLKTKKNHTITKNTNPLANTSVLPLVVLQYTSAVRRPGSPIEGLKLQVAARSRCAGYGAVRRPGSPIEGLKHIIWSKPNAMPERSEGLEARSRD